LTIFLSYADLGFLSAGQKYASEYFAQQNYNEEVKIIGFTSFILLLVLSIFGITFFVLSLNPELILNAGATLLEKRIASDILLVLILSIPINLLQRTTGLIYAVRLKDFIIQRINVVANLVKIASVFYFFENGSYKIVEYFFFTQIINLISGIISILLAKKIFNFDLLSLIHSFRYNKAIFENTKRIAIASLYTTILWIIYYELDSIVIIKFFGSKSLAIFSIALTVLSFYRNILGLTFSPFTSRFNHFIGQSNLLELKSFYFHIVSFFSGLVVIPTIAIFLFATPLISSWIGSSYIESITLVKILTLCNIMAFISYPTSVILIAQEKLKYIYVISTINTLLYWLFILFTYKFLGVESFAYSKLITFFITGVSYIIALLNIMNLNLYSFFKRIIIPLLLPIITLLLFRYFFMSSFHFNKSKIDLFLNVVNISIITIIAFVIYFFSNSDFNKQVKNTIVKTFKR
jgi:O-antigen/teichoic acid export membrane protein